MASADIHGTMDTRDMLKHQVTLHIKVKGARWAFKRLLAMMCFLKFLAWLGGIKAVVFDGEYQEPNEPANAPMERDAKEWFQQVQQAPRFDDL